MVKTMAKPVRVLVFLLNCTWGIIQTFIGFIGFLRFIRKPHYWYNGSIVTIVRGNWGGVSIGAFIFICSEIDKNEASGSMFVNHEYGHCLQSTLLGPLYFLIIAIPSLIWAGCFRNWRKKHNKGYYWLYCESWADAWSGVKRK